MLNIMTSDKRHYVERKWLKGYLTFSFQDYYDEENNDFGNLLVFNEETISPEKGFNLYPTHDIEIITYVNKGQLEHFNDVTNQKSIINPGEIQILHAGDGINHSEKNPSNSEELEYFQFWFLPNAYNKTAGYEKLKFDINKAKNKLLKLFGEEDSIAKIRQDVNFYISNVDSGFSLEYKPEDGRKTFIFLIEGKLSINNNVINKRDSLRTKISDLLSIKALQESKFFLIDLT